MRFNWIIAVKNEKNKSKFSSNLGKECEWRENLKLIVGRDINVIICFCKISHFVIFVQILLKPKQIEYSQFVCKDYSLISHRVCQFVRVHPETFACLYLFFVTRDWQQDASVLKRLILMFVSSMAGVNHIYSHHVFKLLENDCVPRQN